MPVTVVTYDQALGYVRWRAAQEGRPWRLLSELEWQHAARGADQRVYPWGDHLEPRWCQMLGTPGPRRVVPVGTHATDRSVYGSVGHAGNIKEWTEEDGVRRVAQGGTCTAGPRTCWVSERARFVGRHRHLLLGFRIGR